MYYSDCDSMKSTDEWISVIRQRKVSYQFFQSAHAHLLRSKSKLFWHVKLTTTLSSYRKDFSFTQSHLKWIPLRMCTCSLSNFLFIAMLQDWNEKVKGCFYLIKFKYRGAVHKGRPPFRVLAEKGRIVTWVDGD